jgi:hypothetical protein
MKIASISTTKNECDVIEAFVRHNARFCDHFFFIDESVDTTRTILGHLQAEGFGITVFNSGSNTYVQSDLITTVLRHLHSTGGYDWVTLLDADEFLPDVDRATFEGLLAQVPANMLAALAWQTYVPRTRDYFSFEDPIVQNFLPRNTEGPAPLIHKVCVPASLLGVAQADPGNHGAHQAGTPVPGVLLPLRLGHFPVRSTEQIIVKNIVAAHVTSMKEGKTEIEGWHVYKSLEQLRDNRFDVSYDELLKVALTYALAEHPPGLALDQTAPPLRAQALPMRYAHLRYRSPLAALDRELESMAAKVLLYKQIISKSQAALVLAGDKSAEAMGILQSAHLKSV